MSHDLLTSTFLKLRSRLQATARRLLDDDSEADDALQDAFYRLWQHRDDIVSPSQAEGMSVIAVRNTCIDALRRSKLRQNVSLENIGEDPVNDCDDNSRNELFSSVKEIIDTKLSPREKAVITMRDTMDMDFADIAGELGISENNARMILSRARRTVREIYLSSQK